MPTFYWFVAVARNFIHSIILPLPIAFLTAVAATVTVVASAGVAAGDNASPPATVTTDFPRELVDFVPAAGNPVFTAGSRNQWDARIRERGWILREGAQWRMWYTGYDGTREGQKMLGLATSTDGFTWTRSLANPIFKKVWVEDMMIVKQGKKYYMFAEGAGDQAQLLESTNGTEWTLVGPLDVRMKNGDKIPPGPFGTPTAWFENGTWYLFYERRDAGIWLATSRDMKVWKNVRDEPVLAPGPGAYDRQLVAMNQIVKHGGKYYAYYHGSPGGRKPNLWTTNVAVSSDLIHWKKFDGNPLFPLTHDKSSGILVHDGTRYRLYTMHDRVEVHLQRRNFR